MPSSSRLNGLTRDKVISRLWSKDCSLWKDDPLNRELITNSLGWLDLPQVMAGRLPEIETFAQEIRKEGFERVLLLGMGGSSLAPEVFSRSFPGRRDFPTLQVLDSTDPEAVLEADRLCEPAKTLFLVASKSGTTTEPLRLLDYFFGRAKVALKDEAGRHFAAITDPGSTLQKLAKEKGFRKVFLSFPDIGGRYSALSYFGLVPAALIGVDLPTLLKRAAAMAKACRSERAGENPGAILGAEIIALADGGKDKLTFLIPPEISSLGLWLEQLVAESTGQEGRGVVPIAGEPLQENYGEDRAFVHIKLSSSKNRTLDSVAERLKTSHPVLSTELKDPLDLGAEFYRWEIATAVMGHLLAVNVFDQPNVEEAKVKTKSLLEELTKHGELPAVRKDASEGEWSISLSKAGRKGAKDFKAALAGLLGSVRKGEYVALLPYLSIYGSYERELRTLWNTLIKAAGAAVQFGYGPRYLHSTGQLHKGGPNSGLFLIISREDAPRLDIPGSPYTFDQLLDAQSLGDFQALETGGRRAAYLRFTGDPRKALIKLAKVVEAASNSAVNS